MADYRLRNKFHEIIGNYSQEELLKLISKGKFTGDDEEVAVFPFDKWHKLGSHPEFYDAFLRRLFQGVYEGSGPKPEPSASGEKSKSGKVKEPTREVTPAAPENSWNALLADQPVVPRLPDDSLKPVDEEPHRGGGATIHQSLLNELFPEDPAAASPAADAEIPQLGSGESPLSQEIDPQPPGEEVGEAQRQAWLRKRRRYIIYGGLAAGLLLLFKLGGDDTGARLPFSGIPDAENPDLALDLTRENAKSEKVGVLLDEGVELVSYDSILAYREGLDVFREARSFDENNSVLLGRLAQAQARLMVIDPGRYSDAESQIKEWIQAGRRLDPQQPLYYQAEALLALHNDSREKAEKLLGNALEADPANVESLILLAELQLERNGLEEGQRSAAEAIRLGPTWVRGHYLLGKAAMLQKDFLKAKAEALEALKLNPFHVPSFLLLADSAAAKNEFKEARGFYETAGRLVRFGEKRDAARAYARLGELRELSGNDKAQEAYLLAYYYGGNSEYLKKVTAIESPKQRMKSLAEANEFDENYLKLQADSLTKEGKWPEAVRFRTAAQLIQPRAGKALVELGEALEKRAASFRDYQRIAHIYERAIRRAPELPDAYIRLGLLETDQYNLDRGYQLLTHAVQLAPEDANVYVAMGKHYYKRQDFNQALNQFLTAAKLNPADSEILYYAGLLRIMFKKDSARDAMRFFYQAYTLNPQNYQSLVEWLKLKVENHEKTFAIKFIRNLIETDPTNPNLHWAYGEIYAANGEHFRAITNYHRALDFDNRSSRVRMSLGKSLETVGEIEKAIAEYRLASMLDPRNGDGSYRAAKLLVQAKQYQQAEEVLKSLANVTPNYPGAHRELAMVYKARNQEKQALEAMEKEVAINPRNAKFSVELGELYMHFQKYDKAIAELSKVANLPPISKAPEFVYDKIRAYLLIARSYRAQSRYEIAEGTLKLAIEIDPEDPELQRELGYVYHGLQRDKDAIKSFEFYLSRNPAAEDSQTIRGMINQMKID